MVGFFLNQALLSFLVILLGYFVALLLGFGGERFGFVCVGRSVFVLSFTFYFGALMLLFFGLVLWVCMPSSSFAVAQARRKTSI